MDSEEETIDDVDSGNESSGDDNMEFAMEIEAANPRERSSDVDDYPFEVLSTEEIVQHMVDSIKEVNMVVEVKKNFFEFFTTLIYFWITFPWSTLNEKIFFLTTSVESTWFRHQ